MLTCWRSIIANNRNSRLALVFMLFLLYGVAFKTLYPSYHDAVGEVFFAALIIIPLIGVAWLFGFKIGILAWLLSIPLELVLFASCGESLQLMLLNEGGIVSMVMLLAAVIPTGYLHDLKQRSARETAERHKAEAALRESQHFVHQVKEKLRGNLDKEDELSYLKNQLMITLSHEFRTPLSVILASSELLDRYFDRLTPERRDECLTTIKTQIMHLREMLDDIATLVAEGNTAPRFNPAPFDLAAFCQQTVDEFQASIGTAYTLTFKAEGNFDSLSIDINLLRPVLKNLLSNGIKYSDKGGIVDCSLSRQGDEVLLRVTDYGIGIPASEQPYIFEAFYRASNAMHIGGLGLGLHIVRNYVQLHGGSVDLKSEEGKGTTVTVRLPAQ